MPLASQWRVWTRPMALPASSTASNDSPYPSPPSPLRPPCACPPSLQAPANPPLKLYPYTSHPPSWAPGPAPPPPLGSHPPSHQYSSPILSAPTPPPTAHSPLPPPLGPIGPALWAFSHPPSPPLLPHPCRYLPPLHQLTSQKAITRLHSQCSLLHESNMCCT